ncbi:unnamed protein product [Moneuplotes crassus]|uniref:Uncharacterized protein n=1 Tax=Euplotes crassus TaxID=5936 RepID=A0AAD1UN50_EUPCR|nr:unnamed protein product [Moneuplotes crassus]
MQIIRKNKDKLQQLEAIKKSELTMRRCKKMILHLHISKRLIECMTETIPKKNNCLRTHSLQKLYCPLSVACISQELAYRFGNLYKKGTQVMSHACHSNIANETINKVDPNGNNR